MVLIYESIGSSLTLDQSVQCTKTKHPKPENPRQEHKAVIFQPTRVTGEVSVNRLHMVTFQVGVECVAYKLQMTMFQT